MKLESVIINTELQIFCDCDTEAKKASYIAELVYSSKEFNKKIPELMFNFVESNSPEWCPFVIGFIMALKMISEQESANQESELERIFNLK